MTTLREPFDHTLTKVVKTKQGEISLTYVSWSQVADRLDDAAPGWSFTIRQLGDDWCWGQLTLDGRTFDNIGYAENADQDWKKEALKDAVSDALKRCASMAGVGRYLYDKEAPAGRPAAGNGHSAPTPTRPAPVPSRSSTAVPENLSNLDWEQLSPIKPEARMAAVATAPPPGTLTYGELADRANIGGVPIRVLTETAKKMYGQKSWKLTDLTPEQRWAIAEENGLA